MKTLKLLMNRGFYGVAIKLALPIALQNLLVSSFALVDTLMVGQLGDVALSSVGMAAQWSWFLNIAMFGICSGSAMFVAQFFGARDDVKIKKTYSVALISALLMSFMFMLAGIFVSRGIISVFNREAEVVRQGSAYLRIAAYSYPAMALNMIIGAVLRSTERVKLPMFASLAGTLINALLNYVLIFGKLGFPAMGVEGAALATVISAYISPLTLLIASQASKNVIAMSIRQFFNVSVADFRRFFARALPIMLNESLWGLGTMLYSVIFANTGYENYAAVTILRTFENVTYAFFIGMCSACSVMIGKSIGAGKIERAFDDAKRFTILVPALGLAVGAVVAVFRAPLVQVFNLSGNITETTISVASWIMLIYGVHLCVRNIPYIQIVGIFRPGGDTKAGMFYDLVCLWLLALPATALCALVFKLPFVLCYAIMYVCEDYLKTVLCLVRFKSRKWIRPVTDAGQRALQELNEAT